MKAALSLLLASCIQVTHADIVSHASDHPKGDAPFTFDAGSFKGELSDLPIGVFDSGIGGLTVLEALLTMDAFHNETLQPGSDGKPDFADERFQYFGDQANMPYGNYPSAGRTDYLRELIVKDALFLLGQRWFDPGQKSFRRDKPPVKAIVIACNTATAYGIDDIRAALKAWGIPLIVVGVVEAGARGVQDGHHEGAVGVLATVGTCSSGAYPRVIGQTLGLAGRAIPVISQQGSPSLAGVIEGDPAFPNTVPEQCRMDARGLLSAHVQSGSTEPLTTIVLGCTHFPLVQSELAASFERLRQEPEFQGKVVENLVWVNPAEWTAKELFRNLALARLRSKNPQRGDRDSFYISIPNTALPDLPLSTDGGLKKAYKYGRLPGKLDREDTVNVPLKVDAIPVTTRSLIQNRLPAVWSRLKE